MTDRAAYEKEVDRGLGQQEPVFMLFVAIVLGIALVTFALPAIEDDVDAEFEKCIESGGNVSAPGQGEVLYCVYENGTGYKLGVEDEPSPIERGGEDG